MAFPPRASLELLRKSLPQAHAQPSAPRCRHYKLQNALSLPLSLSPLSLSLPLSLPPSFFVSLCVFDSLSYFLSLYAFSFLCDDLLSLSFSLSRFLFFRLSLFLAFFLLLFLFCFLLCPCVLWLRARVQKFRGAVKANGWRSGSTLHKPFSKYGESISWLQCRVIPYIQASWN